MMETEISSTSHVGTREPKRFLPCKICGRKSTGVHYGVVSCEGCKAFFKRGIIIGSKYQCFFGGHCDTTIRSRRCRACRFQKCVREGMSLDAVKMGRIPTFRNNRACEEKKIQKNAQLAAIVPVDAQETNDVLNSHNGAVVLAPSPEVVSYGGFKPDPDSDRNRGPTFHFGRPLVSDLRDDPVPASVMRKSADLFRDFLEIDRKILSTDAFLPDLPLKIELDEHSAFTPNLDRSAVAFRRGELSFGETVRRIHGAIQFAYADEMKLWDEFVVYTQRYGPPEQPQTTIEMFIASLAYSINDGTERAIKFISMLPGVDQFEPAIHRAFVFERWVEIYLFHHSNYMRDGEMYFLLQPQQLHCCRYWVEKLINPDYLKFALTFSKELNDLQLTLIETYCTMCVAVFRQDRVDQSSELSLRRQILYTHYVNVLLRLITERTADSEMIISKLKELMSTLQTAQFLNSKYVPLEDMKVSHPEVGGSAILAAMLAGGDDI